MRGGGGEGAGKRVWLTSSCASTEGRDRVSALDVREYESSELDALSVVQLLVKYVQVKFYSKHVLIISFLSQISK